MQMTKAYAKTINKKDQHARLLSEGEKSESIHAKLLEKMGKAESIAEKLAGDKLFYRNWMWPAGKEFFPHEPNMWFVSRYYPYALGGALLLDEPVTDLEKSQCKVKQEKILAKGFRYYIIDRAKSVEEMLFELGGLTK